VNCPDKVLQVITLTVGEASGLVGDLGLPDTWDIVVNGGCFVFF
jgi:hypothetical protein